MYHVSRYSDVTVGYRWCHWMYVSRRNRWIEWFGYMCTLYRGSDINDNNFGMPRQFMDAYRFGMFKGERLRLSWRFVQHSKCMLFDAVYHAILGMYTRFLYVPERLDIKWVCVYQDRATYPDCYCEYKMPDNELRVPEWIHAFWNDVYSNNIIRIYMSIR